MHPRRRLSALLLLALTACNPTSAAKPGVGPEREVADLITALTPPPAEAVPVTKNEWHRTRKATLERMRLGPAALGAEALRVFRAPETTLPEVRAGLLDIAAHTAAAETTPLLVELVTTFGDDMQVRREATQLLGECAPERALEVLEPIVRERYDGRTYPPEEQMLAAWLTASEALKRDPVPLLALIATDIGRTQDVRHLATRALGRFPSEQGRQALENVLVESSGNGYIRRLAVQALQASLPKEQFCARVKAIQDNEADPSMIDFLESMLVTYCR